MNRIVPQVFVSEIVGQWMDEAKRDSYAEPAAGTYLNHTRGEWLEVDGVERELKGFYINTNDGYCSSDELTPDEIADELIETLIYLYNEANPED